MVEAVYEARILPQISVLYAGGCFNRQCRATAQMVCICSLEPGQLAVRYGSIYRSGMVESQMQQLAMKLESVDSLTLVHPFTQGFDQVSHCVSDDEVHAVAQGENWESISKRTEDIEGKEGARTVYSTTFYIGLAIAPKECAYKSSIVSCAPFDTLFY
jgi:hypothetical protein